MPQHLTTPPPDASLADLDTRIAHAEHQLLQRQRDIRQRISDIHQDTRQSLHPRRLLTPLLGAGVAGLVAWGVQRLWGRASRQGVVRAPSASPAATTARPPGSGVAWGELLLIVWPLLPRRWRARVSPATASAMVALGLPLLHKLMGRDESAVPPATVVNVDLARYAGTWYEVARLPAPFEAGGAGQPTTTYTPVGDGTEIELLKRCPRQGGGERETRGVAHVVPGSGGAKLRVSLLPVWLRWLPLAWADHWILYLDTGYQMALVGDPGRRFLWILSRQPRLPDADLAALTVLAREEGYAVQRLHVPQPPA